MDITATLEIPPHIAEKVWESCKKKNLSNEGQKEKDQLDDYTPSFSEFLGFVETSNPKSAGGFNGMSYHLMQLLPSPSTDASKTYIPLSLVILPPYIPIIICFLISMSTLVLTPHAELPAQDATQSLVISKPSLCVNKASNSGCGYWSDEGAILPA